MKPNVLIFMTDQQQNQTIDLDHPCQMPNVSRLQEEGIRFDHCFTTMAHCCPSRASFMTGLYPSEHGIFNNVSNESAISNTLNEGVSTFSELLNNAGYSMYYSGKWHVSTQENPSDRGWEELAVSADKDAYMGTTIGSWREMDVNKTMRTRQRGEVARPGWGNYQLYGTSDYLFEETHDYYVVEKAVERIKSLKDQSNPWCMYVGTFGPHDPFVIPEKYANMYNPDDIALPYNYYDSLENKPDLYKRMRHVWDQLSEEEVKESIAHYWGYCTMMDDLFGMVLDALNESDQYEDTLVLFLSDHGESLGSHGLYLKGLSPYDETYRIPCVMRWPSGISEPGRNVNALVSMIDFAPTFLDLAGDLSSYKNKGMSLLPWIENNEPKKWRDFIFTQCNGVEVYYTQRIVRTLQYKLVYNPTSIDELYDLETDPHELINLSDDPEMKDIKESLYIKMWQEAADTNDIIFNSYPTVANADIGPAKAIGKNRD